MRKLELTRKLYKDIKKKDHQQMNDYMTALYKLGFDDGLASASIMMFLIKCCLRLKE